MLRRERGADQLVQGAKDVEEKEDGQDGHQQQERHPSHLQLISEAPN